MGEPIKRIGVLTSGGDASGMNAAIRAVVRTALADGMEVFGITRGYEGLIHGDVDRMEIRSVSEILHRGGTILYSARAPEFASPEGLSLGVRTCKQFGLEGIIVIGGDGTFRGACDLSKAGVPCVGIPATIDNDIGCSDHTIGVDTALNTIIECVDKIRDTSHSHDRCSLIEVMGRESGYLALHAGVATGATAILVPEMPLDLHEKVIRKMQDTRSTGKKHFILIAAEGINYDGGIVKLASYIEDNTGVTTRSSVLGYVQRGGSPSARDRVLATRFGVHAVDLLAKGIGNRIVAEKDGKITDFDMKEALKIKKEFDYELYNMTNKISV